MKKCIDVFDINNSALFGVFSLKMSFKYSLKKDVKIEDNITF